MTDNEMVEKYTEVSVNEYKDSLVDIDDIDILREAIAEAYLTGLKIGRQEKWHYIKDGVLPNTELGRVHVTVAYINAYENPCKMDCCFDGTDFIYWDDKKPIGWKKVDIFGKIYAWKYIEKLPEPPKENEE